jgi:SHS2 domain-containing protein
VAPQGPSYRLLEHTADLAFEVEASTWPDLLDAATAALGDLVLADDGKPAGDEVAASVEGADREDVLVAWLNEAVIAYERSGFVARHARVSEASESTARGALLGRRTDPRREPPDRVVKAATYNDLRVEPSDAERPWRARVVLDL